MLELWKRRPSLLNKVTLVLLVKEELKEEEEVDIIEEEEGEVDYKAYEDSKEEEEGILQEVKRKKNNITIVTSMNTMKGNVDCRLLKKEAKVQTMVRRVDPPLYYYLFPFSPKAR